jgi:carboxyl-terminal processing protease
MINGGLHELDPHSQYLNAEQLKRFESDSEGSFVGIGIMLNIDPASQFLKVDHPIPGAPAYEVGILAGDLIVKVGDTSTKGMTIKEAQKLIMGEPGTKVTLTIRRAGRNPTDQPVVVTRGRVPQHPVSGVRRVPNDPGKWEWFVDKPNGIGYVRVSGFNELTTKELKAAVEEIEKEGGKALILDLRENPGGLLNQAIEVANLFLGEGQPIVSTRGRDPEKERVFKAEKGHEIFQGKPIAVLVNDGSASASEIVSSALQDDKRAVIVGERSYGKGSVQKLLRLQVGDQPAAVKLTTETYWRPSGKNMDRKLAEKEGSNEWGVTPDVVVPTTKEEKLRAEVERYKREWVAGKPSVVGPNPPPPPTPPIPKGPDGKPVIDMNQPYVDKPLNAAIDVLKKKLSGVGEAPRPQRRIPELIAS